MWAFPMMAVAALLAITGIYVAFRAGAPAGDPLVSSQAAQTLQITSAELPVGKVGNTYSAHLNAEGESAPYHWTLAGGSLPPGLTLDEASGEIRGTPAAPGVFPVSISVSSASSQTASAPLTLTIDSDLAIVTPPDLPGGVIGQRYATRLAAARRRTRRTFSRSASSSSPACGRKPCARPRVETRSDRLCLLYLSITLCVFFLPYSLSLNPSAR
jgi:hypothetical protein